MTTANINYRYFGDTSVANCDTVRINNTGIIVAATILDKSAQLIHVGLSLVAPGTRFDKEFSRIIAAYRLTTFRAQSAEEFTKHTEEFRLGLEALKYRVRKSIKRVRKTEEEYKAEREAAGDVRPANIGYYKYEIEYFGVADFPISTKYVFSLPVLENDTHNNIDLEILQVLDTLKLPSWTEDVISEARDTINAEDGEDDGMTVEDINAEMEDLKLVACDEGYFVVPSSYEAKIENSITPILGSREDLVEWIHDTLIPCIETSPAEEAEDDADLDEEDDADESSVDIDSEADDEDEAEDAEHYEN